MEDHEDRRHDIAELIIMSYALIGKILARLPIPIQIPQIHADWSGKDASEELIRSMSLIEISAITKVTRILLIQLILDWQTAYTFAALDMIEPAEWRLDNAEYAIARIESTVDPLVDHLESGGDLE